MKRTVCLFLALLIVLSVAGCTSKAEKEAAALEALRLEAVETAKAAVRDYNAAVESFNAAVEHIVLVHHPFEVGRGVCDYAMAAVAYVQAILPCGTSRPFERIVTGDGGMRGQNRARSTQKISHSFRSLSSAAQTAFHFTLS